MKFGYNQPSTSRAEVVRNCGRMDRQQSLPILKVLPEPSAQVSLKTESMTVSDFWNTFSS